MTSLIDWRNFDRELRLKYGGCDLNHGVMVHELLEKGPIMDTVRCPDCDKILLQAPDITQALQDFYAINSPNLHGHRTKWATFEALQFEHERVVRVDWGYFLSNGEKERSICTINYSLRKDGTVSIYRAAHT